MRICFDKSEEWCENEGNALNLIFAHDVYIPTDTEEAVMFALTSEHLVDLRVKFLLTEPAIQFEYAFSMPNIPGISHTMYLKSYREVNLDPTKLKIHVVKAAYCQGRLVNDFADIHLGFDNAQQSQCINIKSCKCYDYEKDSTQ
ncbi:hypothetical protein Y032_0013g2169 [Ancylostoma ceylanicum]|nr:hypothetical protein Y032_0013g2169 [Ancylostoma ceylanicum]